MNKAFDDFIKCGSGFELSAERLYDEDGEPMYYHLRMFGLHYPEDYELVGYDPEALMKEAITDCGRAMEEYVNPKNGVKAIFRSGVAVKGKKNVKKIAKILGLTPPPGEDLMLIYNEDMIKKIEELGLLISDKVIYI